MHTFENLNIVRTQTPTDADANDWVSGLIVQQT